MERVVLPTPEQGQTRASVVYSLDHTQLLAVSINPLLKKEGHRGTGPTRAESRVLLLLVPKKNSTKLHMIHNMKVFNQFYLQLPPWNDHAGTATHVTQIPGSPRRLCPHPDPPITQEIHCQQQLPPISCCSDGTSMASWLFTRIIKLIVSNLQKMGNGIMSYSDDCLMNHKRANYLFSIGIL